MTICYVMSPVGRLGIEADHDAVTGIRWASPGENARDGTPGSLPKEAVRQLDRYFARELRRFDLQRGRRCATFPTARPDPRPIGMACGRNRHPERSEA